MYPNHMLNVPSGLTSYPSYTGATPWPVQCLTWTSCAAASAASRNPRNISVFKGITTLQIISYRTVRRQRLRCRRSGLLGREQISQQPSQALRPIPSPAGLRHRLRAQAAIALRLRFVEELVGRGFVREIRVIAVIADDIRGLVIEDERLDVDQEAVRRFTIDGIVPDPREGESCFVVAQRFE